jgi:formylglycine-generating enzyme
MFAAPFVAGCAGLLGIDEDYRVGSQGEGGGGPCPNAGGPAMVDVGAYCIDATEVTRAQYQAFVDDDPDPTGGHARCGFNTSVSPEVFSAPDEPVRGVDWCDAFAFCAWAGKRLCGAVSGGPLDMGSFADPARSQWFGVCSQGGLTPYPYGTAWEAGRCADTSVGAVRPAGQGGCRGADPPYDAVFDMSGNVWEWEDACAEQEGSGRADACRRRGGSFSQTQGNGLECADNSVQDRSATADNLGFRCCAP